MEKLILPTFDLFYDLVSELEAVAGGGCTAIVRRSFFERTDSVGITDSYEEPLE